MEGRETQPAIGAAGASGSDSASLEGEMFLVGIAVMSLDGCLTRHDRPGTGFASPADHAFFRDALRTFDCSLAGRRTYEAGRQSILRSRDEPRLQMILTSTPDLFAADARTDHLEFRNAGVGEAVAELVRRGRARCAVVGGSSVYTEACARGLLREFWITVEPVAFGEGIRMFEGQVDFAFELRSSEVLSGGTMLLKYRRAGKASGRDSGPGKLR